MRGIYIPEFQIFTILIAKSVAISISSERLKVAESDVVSWGHNFLHPLVPTIRHVRFTRRADCPEPIGATYDTKNSSHLKLIVEHSLFVTI